ncbi:MAG: hypothetical protein HW416_3106 [Chloroflexi bacterium]|nr:hypothetical protein [Chloroflexota bacterium]
MEQPSGHPHSRERDPNHKVETEPSARWVRVKFAGATIVDTRNALLLRETRHTPVYYFPPSDVRMDLMHPTDLGTHCPYKGDASYWTLTVGDKVAENVAWSYLAPLPEQPALAGLVAFYWNKMDGWYEEEEEIFVHARDPHKRIDVLESSRHVRIDIGGQTVADTKRPRLLFETGIVTRYYIPPEDVSMDRFQPSEKHSRCPYKGIASYWTARIGDSVEADVVWSYPEPIAECPKIKGLLAFYNERVDVYVDGELQAKPPAR